MDLAETVEQAWEQFRIDPVGVGYVGLGLAIPVVAEGLDVSRKVTVAGSIASLALVVGGGVHLDNMHEYGERLKNYLVEKGFDESAPLRMRAYCLRQASIAVCEATGYLQNYIDFCESKDGLRYTFLPHLGRSRLFRVRS